MDKAPDAFRTISEVAESLETPAHVLRFWESRFPQIKPVKRAGGRRYYRPADVALLSGIRQLLHAEGMTIRGVQKILREQGVRHVATLGGADMDALDLEAEETLPDTVAGSAPETEPPRGQVLAMGKPRRTSAEPSTAIPSEVQSLFPQAEPHTPDRPTSDHDMAPSAEPSDVASDAAADTPSDTTPPSPWDGEGGFRTFTSSRPRTRPSGLEVGPPAQASLPFDSEAPEAPHVWLDDEAEPDEAGSVHALPSAPVEDRVAGIVAEELAAALSDEIADAILAAGTEAEDAEPEEAEATEIDLAITELVATELVTAELVASDLEGPVAGDPVARDPDAGGTYAQGRDSSAADDDSPYSPPVPDFTGLAARLRALTGKVSPQARAELGELHSRLGLLHAQMAEAVRLRR